MESLETSINYWEDAMSAYIKMNAASETLAITNEEESEFCRALQKLLKSAYKLQDNCELLFLDQVILCLIFLNLKCARFRFSIITCFR